ncbi:hypothetical protein AZI86_12245 [Bdellovibrio bacteriovorus]|uniref:DUF3108 domain-containing protein n=1 Tax=Bdellovibrio bacteriovorus TaxID=959 RepID=A0A150WM00_BDEBC|nr:DUF3108 domain-containing protein [Bdellovibrio bacteriovorus]KYG64958.1 hypothetical protein AZI86_12245 [Bdellovibrio bacteriovorus]
MRFSLAATVVLLLVLTSCASSSLKYEKTDELKKNKEFEDAVKIVKPNSEPETEASATPAPTPTPAPSKSSSKKSSGKKTTPTKKTTAVTSKKTADKAAASAPVAAAVRQPDIEDNEGFAPGSRRPWVDPFRVGEEVVHDVHYFKVSAGELRMKVEPFSKVNNRKSYTFAIEIKTSSLFNAFYSVEDRVETFVDYEDLVPRVFQLHVKESKQLREAKMLFDTEKNIAKFWEKKVTKEDGEEEKKQEWEIQEYAQNVYSAVFYMRNFKWETGKEYSFRVANDNENLVFSGKALRREVLDTKLGPMKAIVIQPNIVLKGKFKPIGENLIWLSDDDRKHILRIEAKIKIGTLISEVVSIKPGKP